MLVAPAEPPGMHFLFFHVRYSSLPSLSLDQQSTLVFAPTLGHYGLHYIGLCRRRPRTELHGLLLYGLGLTDTRSLLSLVP